jgi:hypothetical protein
MAAKADYEVKTQQKFTTIALKANLDHITPDVGMPCLIGGNLVGVVVSDRVKGGVADDKVVVDLGRSVYMTQVDSPIDASGEIAEGALIYYEVGTSAEPFLTTVATANVLAGVAVLANDSDTFPKGATGTATVESVAVLFNA